MEVLLCNRYVEVYVKGMVRWCGVWDGVDCSPAA